MHIWANHRKDNSLKKCPHIPWFDRLGQGLEDNIRYVFSRYAGSAVISDNELQTTTTITVLLTYMREPWPVSNSKTIKPRLKKLLGRILFDILRSNFWNAWLTCGRRSQQRKHVRRRRVIDVPVSPGICPLQEHCSVLCSVLSSQDL